MRKLNEMQKKAVDADQGHYLVLAGAGSGKTTVLTERAIRLIDSCKAMPREILSITFTNKAAQEMKNRIAAQAGGIDLRDMWTCTFHSMCVRILRIFPAPGYTSSFTIYDADETQRLVKNILKETGNEKRVGMKPSALKGLISQYKNSEHVLSAAKKKETPADGYISLAALYDDENTLSFGQWARKQHPDVSAKLLDEIYDWYTDKLLSENAMDFDDLLLNALSVLENNDRARKTLQKRFRYIMVDEYQDTNPVQYMLVRILAERHGNLFCVGDDDQSIYGFRGTDIRIIRAFKEEFPDAKIIRLEQNYRSVNSILNAANAVISHNSQRLGKTLWSENGAGEPPVVVDAEDEREEAEAIAEEIRILHDEEGEPYSANAVLYRTHAISRAIEEKLIEYGIPYRVHGGVGFYSRKEIKDMLAYLAIIANPSADQQLLRIINVPKRAIGAVAVAELMKVAADNDIPILEVMRDADKYLDKPATIRKAKSFVQLYDELAKDADKLPVKDTIAKIYDLTGYKKMLEDEHTDESAGRIENIGELISSAAIYDLENDDGLVGFMQNMALLTDQDAPGQQADAVTLMTVHGAKGLEFDNVYIAGLAEDIFPSYRALENGDVEEERRLCYVALTRARKRLMLLSSEERYLFGQTHYYEPSRFIDEIPRKQLNFIR